MPRAVSVRYPASQGATPRGNLADGDDRWSAPTSAAATNGAAAPASVTRARRTPGRAGRRDDQGTETSGAGRVGETGGQGRGEGIALVLVAGPLAPHHPGVVQRGDAGGGPGCPAAPVPGAQPARPRRGREHLHRFDPVPTQCFPQFQAVLDPGVVAVGAGGRGGGVGREADRAHPGPGEGDLVGPGGCATRRPRRRRVDADPRGARPAIQDPASVTAAVPDAPASHTTPSASTAARWKPLRLAPTSTPTHWSTRRFRGLRAVFGGARER